MDQNAVALSPPNWPSTMEQQYAVEYPIVYKQGLQQQNHNLRYPRPILFDQTNVLKG